MAIFMPKYEMAANLLARRCDYKPSKSIANPHIEFGDNLFSIYGGGDASRDKNVQGLTIAGLVLDEIPLLQQRICIHQSAKHGQAIKGQYGSIHG